MPFSSWLLHDIGQKTKLCPKKNTLMGPSFPNKLIAIKNNKIYYAIFIMVITKFYKKEKHCLLEFLTAEEEHNTLKHLVNANGSDGKSLFHLVKELYVELDSTNFGKLISKFERCLLPCDFDLLKGFFEERMMSTCERFTLKAIEECNKN